MTAPDVKGRTTQPSPVEGPGGSPAQRARFAAALALFGAWVVALAALAVRSDPPRPGAEDARPSGAPAAALGDR